MLAPAGRQSGWWGSCPTLQNSALAFVRSMSVHGILVSWATEQSQGNNPWLVTARSATKVRCTLWMSPCILSCAAGNGFHTEISYRKGWTIFGQLEITVNLYEVHKAKCNFFFSIRLIKWPCQRKKEMHRDFTGHTLVKWSCKNQTDLLMIRKCEGNCMSPRYNPGH